MLTKSLNRDINNKRRAFLLCTVYLFYYLSTQNSSGLYILFINLIEAIKLGKLSKKIGQYISRQLQK